MLHGKLDRFVRPAESFLGTNLEADRKGARLMAAFFQAPGAVRALPWLH